jgi:hypothetical protein
MSHQGDGVLCLDNKPNGNTYVYGVREQTQNYIQMTREAQRKPIVLPGMNEHFKRNAPNYRSTRASDFKSFAGCSSNPIASTSTCGAISLRRVGLGRPPSRVEVQFTSEDAYYVVFSLRENPSHEYWEGGQPFLTPFSPQGCIHIADLRRAPGAVILERFDSINIAVTQSYFDDLADDIGAPRIEALQVPDSWRTPDPTLESLTSVFLRAGQTGDVADSLFVDQLCNVTALHLANKYGQMKRALACRGGLSPWQQRRAQLSW